MCRKTIVLPLLVLLLLCGGCTTDFAVDSVEYSLDTAQFNEQAVTAIAEVRQELYDYYFTYYTADELKLLLDDYEGAFGGVGIAMFIVDDQVMIASVNDDGPAQGVGLVAGDVITAVNGQSLTGIDDINLVALKIRGDLGTEVTLTILHENGVVADYTMVRDTVSTVSVEGQMIEELPGLAYISIGEFTETTSEEFINEYNRLQEEQTISGLILDLRSNTGGSFYAAINIANLFVAKDSLIVTEKQGEEQEQYTSVSGVLADLPIAVLQNAYTASASEVLAGALSDCGNTVLIGSTSFGKGITQSVISLDSGYGLRYTRGKYLTPSGFSLHGVGLAPDILVEDPEGIAVDEYFSVDPAKNPHLAAALTYFKANVYTVLQ